MAGTEIRSITARQVYTNRGNPGVEAVVTTENGATGRAMCTSGISIGTHEIHFDFDGGERFRGKGVLGAVRNVNEIIAPALKGLDAANQRLIDRTMLDIVPDAKAKLGGNATAAVSAAVLKAGAAALGIPLYRHIGGANAMYLPVPGVAMVAGHERYGGGITTPGGKPTMSVMCFASTRLPTPPTRAGISTPAGLRRWTSASAARRTSAISSSCRRACSSPTRRSGRP